LFPSHVVCEWIGHTREVARKHYLQVTEDHFAKAISAAENPQHTSSALQFALQKYGEKPCNSVQAKKEQVDTSADTSSVCINLHSNVNTYSGRTQTRTNALFPEKNANLEIALQPALQFESDPLKSVLLGALLQTPEDLAAVVGQLSPEQRTAILKALGAARTAKPTPSPSKPT